MDEIIQIKHALVLKEAKNVFNKVIKEDPIMEGLCMIDAIQRLSIDHLFEEQIQQTLLKQTSIISDFTNHLHLSQVVLQFRLLKQAGIDNSPSRRTSFGYTTGLKKDSDIFDNFKDKQGELKEEYREDIKGLVALYEASQLSIEGEDSLHDAGNLSRQLLEAWLSKPEGHHEAKVVTNTLENPLHQSFPRFANTNINLSSSDVVMRSNRWASFLELAEINSCIIRHLNQNELFQVSKWWREVEVATEMKFGRMKVAKWSMWPIACLTDPKFSEQRIELTKSVSLVDIIDDIFDVYGSLDDLTHFTDAVNRWDSNATVQLPGYMKSCFNLLHDKIDELASKVQQKHGLNPSNALKKSVKTLLNSFLVEAIWLNSGDLPKAKEYLENGIVSSGIHVVFLHVFFLLLDQNITQQNVAVMDQIPSLSSLVGKILRLCDDLEGAKSEDRNGMDGSYLECYIKENDGVSVEDAQTHVAHLISNAWKHLNQENLITSSSFPPPFTKFCLNASRMVLLMYSYRRNQSLLKYVMSLFRVDEATYEHIHIPSNPKGHRFS